MDSLEGAIRLCVSDHLGHRQEVDSIRSMMEPFKQAANVCTIQHKNKIYATGMRPDLNLANALYWRDADEEKYIIMKPFVENNQAQRCAIEDVLKLELHVGGRVVSFCDATRTICDDFDESTGDIEYCFIFEDLIPDSEPYSSAVEVTVRVVYRIQPGRLADVNLDASSDERNAATHPSRFSTSDLLDPVIFCPITFTAMYEIDSEDDEGVEENET